MKKILLVISVLLVSANSFAQNVAACNAAQPVCTNPNFQFTSSAGSGLTMGLNVSNPSTNPQMGNGNNPAAPANSGCLFSQGPGPQWLLLTISSNGTLGFSFGAAGSANPQVGFYDWAMWPYTSASCTNIFNNTLPPVSCNWNASSSGGTGMGPVPPGGVAGNYQPSLNVTAGQQFLILISNYSGVNTAVSFSNTGTAGISCNPFVIAPQTICNGSSAVLTGSTTLTNASATITPGGAVSTGSNIAFTVSPTSNTTYTVTLQGTNTLNSVVTVTTITNVTVITPTVAVNSNSTVCENGSVNLTASATGTVTYNWTGPNGFNSTLQNPVMNNLPPQASGIYSVQLASTTGTLVCYAGNTTSVTVIPVPQVTVAPSVISVCQDDNFGFSAGAPGATTYSWTGPNVFSSSSPNIAIGNAVPAMTGIYSVTATFVQNGVTCASSNSVDVTVKPKVHFTLTPIPNVCDNTTLLVNGPAGATSYTWSGPNGFNSNTQDLTINNANTSHSGIYTLIVDVNGCKTQDSLIVSVLTPVTFSIVPNNVSICRGDTVDLYTLPIGGTGVYNISWLPNSGIFAQLGNNAIALPAVSTNYTIVVNDVACPTQSVTTNFIIYVNPAPAPNIAASTIEGCAPLCINLQSFAAPQAVNVFWSFGGNLNAVGDSINFCFKNPGTYSITTTIIDINGCRSTSVAPFPITVYPRPQPDFSWNPSEPSLIENIVNFTSYYVNGPITSYHWDFGDTYDLTYDTSSLAHPTHEFNLVGMYPVTLIETNIHGCTDTITKMVTVVEDFTLYVPNAFTPNGDGHNDIFQPKGMGFKPDSYEMQIFDRWGNSIFRTTDVSKGWDGTVKGSTLKDDVYVYRIKCITSNGNIRKEKTGHVTLIK